MGLHIGPGRVDEPLVLVEVVKRRRGFRRLQHDAQHRQRVVDGLR